ncbi:histidinol phosphatase [Agrococcus sp. SL85]|uniref:inositol monophosphatase family protein n=1 Tax=Agrococcus sp. SL85 TaxID=2995141 RepID=UPI00226C94BA|nr:inositol monophosphatase family protein [Agrococcus sp. SL85]WAC65562.1 histidinol phosphatase [Agrococcus sp. SL85]
MSRYDADLDLALRMADAADAISMERFGARDLEVTTKPDATHVTDADRAVERRIRDMLADERPDDAVFGEEFGSSGQAPRQWIIDPIDGTAHFLRGAPVWATLIALAVDGHPVVGVVSSPALGGRWWAAQGSGAWKRGEGAAPQRIRVSEVADLADAAISYNSIQGWDGAGRIGDLVALQRDVWRARSYGDAWSYMLLAEGKVDAVGEFDLKPYDMAALVPVVEEAGGAFTSVDGEPGPWHGSALATNGVLHAELLRRLAR